MSVIEAIALFTIFVTAFVTMSLAAGVIMFSLFKLLRWGIKKLRRNHVRD